MIKPYVWVCSPDHPKTSPPTKAAGCVRLRALVDTGAECSFVNLKKVAGFRKARKKCNVAGLCGVGRGDGRQVDLQIWPPGCSTQCVRAVGVEGKPFAGVDLILGFDYLKKAKMWIQVSGSRGGGSFGCKVPTAKTKTKTRTKAAARRQ